MLESSSGEILVEGRPQLEWDPIRLRRRIGYVIQDVGLFPHWTVEQNVALVPRLEGWPEARVRERVREMLALVGLDVAEFAARKPSELSGGQRQRVGVARALAADPPILLMDEPFGALDPVTRAELQREFRELAARLEKTIVFVTHDLREALLLGTRIALFADGPSGRRLYAGGIPARSRDPRPGRLSSRSATGMSPAMRVAPRVVAIRGGERELLEFFAGTIARKFSRARSNISGWSRRRCARPCSSAFRWESCWCGGTILRRWVLGAANVIQTIPSLALFGFLIPVPFLGGIGASTAIVALALYALLPILRNTYTGIAGVDPAVLESARAMGMTPGQILWQVELPLSMGVILAGVRVATVICIGVATIAAAIGAGGLGVFIFRGVAMVSNAVILAGAIPAALLAIAADFVSAGGAEAHALETRSAA